MTNLPKLHQALHDASDEEIVGALHYLGKAERIAAALNAQLPVRAVEYGSREHADKLSAEIAELRETLEKANDAYAQGVTAGRSEALNAQAGGVEALRPLAEAVERLDNARHGNDFVGTICAQSQIIEAARAALAAVKEKDRG
jgi:flagellar biosynthesis/type III secretory pathway protein FliH